MTINSALTDETTLKAVASSAGTVVDELPAGRYDVFVSYGGKEAEVLNLEVEGEGESTVELRIPVFLEVAGWAMSTMEFVELMLLIISLVVILVLVAYEYVSWRRKRLVKVSVAADSLEFI